MIKYLSWRNILSYNALMNFIITERGYGKTYGMLRHLVKQHLKHGKRVVGLSRYKARIGATAKGWAYLIQEIYPNLKVTMKTPRDKQATIFINDIEFMRVYSTTMAEEMKSIADLKTFDFLFYDEFITSGIYANDEVDNVLSILSTMDRGRLYVKSFLLGNAISKYNPYFTKLGVKRIEKHYNSKTRILVYLPTIKFNGNNITDVVAKDTDYNKMSKGNIFMDDIHNLVIEKTNIKRNIQFNIRTHEGLYGVYNNHVSTMNNTNKPIYHVESVSKSSTLMNRDMRLTLAKMYFKGIITFENIRILENVRKELKI